MKVEIDETELAELENEILNDEPEEKEDNEGDEAETDDKSEHEQVYFHKSLSR